MVKTWNSISQVTDSGNVRDIKEFQIIITNGDAQAAVQATGYFDKYAFRGSTIGDRIRVEASDSTVMYEITGQNANQSLIITPIPAGASGTDDQSALEVPYTAPATGLTAGTASVQAALDQIGGATATNIPATDPTTGPANGQTDTAGYLSALNGATKQNQDAIGVAGAVNLGTFTGSVISDNVTAKVALQEVETALEGQTLNAHSDVNAPTPTDGQVLTWVNASSEWQAVAPGAAGGIDSLTDVDTSTVPPTDGQVLAWDNANSVWEPASVAGAGSIDGLTDVDTSTIPPATNDFLKWNGSEWAPAAVSVVANPSTDANNDISSGTDSNLFLDVSAKETSVTGGAQVSGIGITPGGTNGHALTMNIDIAALATAIANQFTAADMTTIWGKIVGTKITWDGTDLKIDYNNDGNVNS